MYICSTHLKLKKMSNICDFDRILKTECNLTLKEIGQTRIVERRTFKCEGERNDHMLHYEQVFGNVFERRESKCCAVLMKHRCKVKGEQVTLQMAQLLKTKNINVVLGQLFCRRCKAKFLLETDLLY